MMKKKSTHGGKREGSGRPAGSKNKATKEKEAIEREFKRKIMRSVNRLFNAQMHLAEGTKYLWRIDKDKDGNKKKPALVTSPAEIESFLRDEVDEDSYYYISTGRPDNRAIDSMLDRLFGKAVQNIDATSDGEKIAGIMIYKPESKSG